MRIQIIILLIACFSIMTVDAQDLKKHRWENRILIIKTTAIDSKNYQKQREQFVNSVEELKDRKFVIYQVIGNDFEVTNYANNELNTFGKVSKELQKKLNLTSAFEIILIGLDGGIKLQQTNVLTKEELFRIIDSMPMRRSEMRRKKGEN